MKKTICKTCIHCKSYVKWDAGKKGSPYNFNCDKNICLGGIVLECSEYECKSLNQPAPRRNGKLIFVGAYITSLILTIVAGAILEVVNTKLEMPLLETIMNWLLYYFFGCLGLLCLYVVFWLVKSLWEVILDEMKM